MYDINIGPRPSFLDRTPGDVRPVRRQRKGWKPGKAGQAAAARDRQKRAQESARGPVERAVKAGANTLGKIRAATGLDNQTIKPALNWYIKSHRIVRVGKRYLEG